MAERIKAKAAEHLGCWVSKPVCNPPVGHFMHCHGQKYGRDKYDEPLYYNSQIHNRYNITNIFPGCQTNIRRPTPFKRMVNLYGLPQIKVPPRLSPLPDAYVHVLRPNIHSGAYMSLKSAALRPCRTRRRAIDTKYPLFYYYVIKFI